jgi:hypothetical protein
MLASVARDIDPPALARADSATTRRHVAVEINKAFGEIRLPPGHRVSYVPAGAGVRASWGCWRLELSPLASIRIKWPFLNGR